MFANKENLKPTVIEKSATVTAFPEDSSFYSEYEVAAMDEEDWEQHPDYDSDDWEDVNYEQLIKKQSVPLPKRTWRI